MKSVKINFKIDKNEITIQNNGIEITFEIKMMPDEEIWSMRINKSLAR